MRLTVVAYGIQQTIQKAVRQSDLAAEAFVQGMVYEAEKVMTESQRQVPVDTGRLKNSKFVDHRNDRDGVVSTIGYRTEYAIHVHERDRNYRGSGKWQYLRDPLSAAMPGMKDRVAEYVRKAIG